VPLILLGFLFFTGTVPRRYLLFLYGTILPVMLAIMFYMFTGRLQEVLRQYVYSIVEYPTSHYFSWLELLILFALPLFFLFGGIIRVIQGARLTVFQSNLSQFMILWLFFGALYVFLIKEMAPGYLIFLIPPAAFFISHYFFSFRKKWIAEIVFMLFMAGPVLFNLGTVFSWFITAKYIDLSDYTVENTAGVQVSGQSTLVLSPDLNYYRNASPATPFLDYYLSWELFANPGYYDNLTKISNGFAGDMPDLIIDPDGLMKGVFEKMPSLERQFRQIEAGRYERLEN
jgi:hypothetical protein